MSGQLSNVWWKIYCVVFKLFRLRVVLLFLGKSAIPLDCTFNKSKQFWINNFYCKFQDVDKKIQPFWRIAASNFSKLRRLSIVVHFLELDQFQKKNCTCLPAANHWCITTITEVFELQILVRDWQKHKQCCECWCHHYISVINRSLPPMHQRMKAVIDWSP